MDDYLSVFEEGYEAFKKGEYSTTLALWEPLVEKGVAWAQHNVASLCYKGWGTERDVMRGHHLSSMAGSKTANMKVIEIPSGDVLGHINMVDPRFKK